jgi:hypothetical protein
MINHATEHLIRPKDACRLFPGRSGKGISLATCWRWMLHGRRGVKLESLLAFGTRYTSHEAVARFLAALNRQPRENKDPAPGGQQQSALVEAELKQAGF